MKRLRGFLVLPFVLLLVLTTAACTSGGDGEYELNNDGELVVAMSGEYRPFNYVENGKLTGFDYDIAKALADDLGLKLVTKTAGFATLVEGTAQGRYDMLVASTTANVERAQVVDFARGYYSSGAQVHVKKGQPCKPLKEMDNPQVGVANGTTYHEYLKKNEITNQIKTYEADATALEDTAAGRLDAALTDRLLGKFHIKHAGLDLEPCGEPLTHETMAPAIGKGKPKLLAAVNKSMDKILSDGTYAKISKKWFGEDISPKIDQDEVDKVMAQASDEVQTKPLIDIFTEYFPVFVKAAGWTLAVTGVALIIAVALGSVIAWMNMSSILPLRWLAVGFIGLIRGTPLIAQLFVLYFGLTQLVLLNSFWAGAIALAIHNSAYIAEIVRSGFSSVPPGLVEASRSLGLSRLKTLRWIQVPLATRTILPVLGNQFIIAVKDSSLVAFIGMAELFREAQNTAAAEFAPLKAYLIVSIYYLVIVLVLTGIVHMLERWMDVEAKAKRNEMKKLKQTEGMAAA